MFESESAKEDLTREKRSSIIFSKSESSVDTLAAEALTASYFGRCLDFDASSPVGEEFFIIFSHTQVLSPTRICPQYLHLRSSIIVGFSVFAASCIQAHTPSGNSFRPHREQKPILGKESPATTLPLEAPLCLQEQIVPLTTCFPHLEHLYVLDGCAIFISSALSDSASMSNVPSASFFSKSSKNAFLTLTRE